MSARKTIDRRPKTVDLGKHWSGNHMGALRGLRPVNLWHDAQVDFPDDDTDVLCCSASRDEFWVGCRSAGAWLKEDSSSELDMTLYTSHWTHLPEGPQ